MMQLLGGNASMQSALPILLDAALKGAFLVLLAALAAFALRKRSAASRHAVWTTAGIGHLAIPALVFILPAWKMPLLPAASWMQPTTVSPAITAAPDGSSAAAAITTRSKASTPLAPASEAQTAASTQATESGAEPPTTLASRRPKNSAGRTSGIAILATAWFIGALLVLLRLAFGTWRVGQLARDGARVEDGVWLSLTQRLANRLGVTRPLTLLRGERLAVPVTWGIIYPAVLLPQDSDNWSEERRRFVLVHEMAHVKRFDALTQLLAQVAVAIFWFDPLVWVAAHQMRVEREHACDDYVLRDRTCGVRRFRRRHGRTLQRCNCDDLDKRSIRDVDENDGAPIESDAVDGLVVRHVPRQEPQHVYAYQRQRQRVEPDHSIPGDRQRSLRGSNGGRARQVFAGRNAPCATVPWRFRSIPRKNGNERSRSVSRCRWRWIYHLHGNNGWTHGAIRWRDAGVVCGVPAAGAA